MKETSEGAADLPALHLWARLVAGVGLVLVPVAFGQAVAEGLDKYGLRTVAGADVYLAIVLSAALGLCALLMSSRTTEPVLRASVVGCQLFVLFYAFSAAAG
ncbi:hypothetical protein [Streptomyces sp. SM12]|uniref:hypothetical protein n=1 Tax=Streptomyces sp. SM12 TaxID=1071602 RepID=UPI000CD584E8|nr:hypothetical protein [Streptomyces sp. SM12]